jgi:hypothetical protein
MKAICDPSGDQLGHLSCAPDECVRLRVGPFSIGAVKMSPRAENKAFRAQLVRLDIICGWDAAGPARQAVVRNRDRNRRSFSIARVEHLQLAVHLEHDAVLIVSTGPTHVPKLAVCDLRRLSAAGVVRVEIEMAVAI